MTQDFDIVNNADDTVIFDFEIINDDAANLIKDCGIFVLSDGDQPGAVLDDLKLVLTQPEYDFVDAFPATYGARVVALKRIGLKDGPNGPVAVWTSDF